MTNPLASVFASTRRALVALSLLSLPLAASTCGGSDTPQPRAADPVVYTVRYSISGNGTQANVNQPYCQVSFSACHPDLSQRTGSCAAGSELLSVPVGAGNNIAANVPTTTTALNTTASLSGRTLYLSVRFYSAVPNPPSPSSVISAELLANGSPVQSVLLTAADAAQAANQYADGIPNNHDAMKFVRVVLP